ncbi:MAG: FAD-dependent oxidoreductase [Alphaproteobacteria bacterium]|nr:FAD-dependent oxidoreductase [Alphaproteobacteria bacterium]
MTAPEKLQTTCCIVGGGPAGIVAGLLLARQGVDVVVLEKHADFLRDFRGDTIHPSTLELLHELGWLDAFLQLPHSRMTEVTVSLAGSLITFADFTRLNLRCPYVAFMPQWDFLNFMTEKARAFDNFRLRMRAEATDLLVSSGRVVGVRARTDAGPLEVHAQLVLGCDGRRSIFRDADEMEVIAQSAPMDVLWFRLPRRPDEALPFFVPGRGRVLICIDRGAYWQIAYVIPKGGVDDVKAAGIDALRANVAAMHPQLADRVDALQSWADVPFLRVQVDRLRRWYREGLLCIGDAAHAMSPAGGVGINLAIQDAVAAANLLGPTLRQGRAPSLAELRRVQRRRALPTRVTQALQVRAAGGLYPRDLDDDPSAHVPFAFRLFKVFPLLRHLAGRIIGQGVRSEHVR